VKGAIFLVLCFFSKDPLSMACEISGVHSSLLMIHIVWNVMLC